MNDVQARCLHRTEERRDKPVDRSDVEPADHVDDPIVSERREPPFASGDRGATFHLASDGMACDLNRNDPAPRESYVEVVNRLRPTTWISEYRAAAEVPNDDLSGFVLLIPLSWHGSRVGRPPCRLGRGDLATRATRDRGRLGQPARSPQPARSNQPGVLSTHDIHQPTWHVVFALTVS